VSLPAARLSQVRAGTPRRAARSPDPARRAQKNTCPIEERLGTRDLFLTKGCRKGRAHCRPSVQATSTVERAEMLAQDLLRPMSEFDPLEPALLHDRLKDQIIPWTGEEGEVFRRFARFQPDGTVSWDGFMLDGWDEPLGG
jgi:hypothetical protein